MGRTGHSPSNADAKKLKSLTLNTHDCRRASLRDLSSSSDYSVVGLLLEGYTSDRLRFNFCSGNYSYFHLHKKYPDDVIRRTRNRPITDWVLYRMDQREMTCIAVPLLFPQVWSTVGPVTGDGVRSLHRIQSTSSFSLSCTNPQILGSSKPQNWDVFPTTKQHTSISARYRKFIKAKYILCITQVKHFY